MKLLLKSMTAVMLIAGSSLLNAQDLQSNSNAKRDSYSKGSAYRSTYVEYYESEESDKDLSIIQLNVERGKYAFHGFSLIGNAYLLMARGRRTPEDGDDFVEQEADVFGAGFNGMIRWEFLRVLSHSLFVEAGAGMVFTTGDLPPGGTFWNFNQRYGFGLAIGINEGAKVLIGWRH
ncbi:MAG: hypothetical protein ACE5I1_19275, partial [bacterium]